MLVISYVIFDLMFLVPLFACVSIPIIKRDQPAEIRFLRLAFAHAAFVLTLNVAMLPTGITFPAFMASLLLVTAYAIHPSIPSALTTSVLACFSVMAGSVAADWYADANRGSFADLNHPLFLGLVSLLCGLVTVIATQTTAKILAAKSSTVKRRTR